MTRLRWIGVGVLAFLVAVSGAEFWLIALTLGLPGWWFANRFLHRHGLLWRDLIPRRARGADDH